MRKHTKLPDGTYSPFTEGELLEVEQMTRGQGVSVDELVSPSRQMDIRHLYQVGVSMHTLRVLYDVAEWRIRRILGMKDWQTYRYVTD